MDQKIALSTANVSPTGRPDHNWRMLLRRIWSSAMLAAQNVVASIRSFRNPLNSVILPTLNIDRISARLALANRAQVDGRNELPRSTEEVVTGTQKEIVVYFKNLQRKFDEQAATIPERMRDLGDRIDLSETVRDLRDIPPRCENELVRISAKFQLEHDSAWEQEIQHQRHYERFRDENALSRVASYPSSPVIPYAITAALVIVGTVAFSEVLAGLNSSAIVPPSWTFRTLMLVALVPFVLARSMFRLVNHVREARQIVGLLGGIMAIAFIGGLAIFVAHYISTIAVDPEATVRSVVGSILQAPTSWNHDTASWTGSGIVVLVGLAAFLVGYKSDDSYPGYGAVQRSFYRARDERNRFVNRMRKRMNIIVDKAETEVSKLRRRVTSNVGQFSKLVDKSKRVPAAHDDYNLALEDACNILLDRYRVANSEVRQSEAPISFSEYICFRSDEEETASEITNGERRRGEFQKGTQALEDEVAQVRQKLRDLNSSAISPLEKAAGRGESPGDSDGDRSAR